MKLKLACAYNANVKPFLTHLITDFCYIYYSEQAIKYRKLIAVANRELQFAVFCKNWDLRALLLPGKCNKCHVCAAKLWKQAPCFIKQGAIGPVNVL